MEHKGKNWSFMSCCGEYNSSTRCPPVADRRMTFRYEGSLLIFWISSSNGPNPGLPFFARHSPRQPLMQGYAKIHLGSRNGGCAEKWTMTNWCLSFQYLFALPEERTIRSTVRNIASISWGTVPVRVLASQHNISANRKHDKYRQQLHGWNPWYSVLAWSWWRLASNEDDVLNPTGRTSSMS